MSLPNKSSESLLSGSSRESACQIYQRKQPARVKTNGGIRQPSMVPSNTSSDIHQRVVSARNLRAKTIQNQLADAQAEITNLAQENRVLRTMHKRQSLALNKYESSGAELPQLLHKHAEELRVWQTKHRNLQSTNKDLELKVKQKEREILTLSDQNKYYNQLIKDKNLDERQKLQDKLRQLEQRLLEKDNDIKLMERKMQLETKNFRQQLLNEQRKSKEVMLRLEKARIEISGYRKLEEFAVVDKANPLATGRRPKLNAVDDTDKIDKLEKSLELLDKVIEKNNQAEYNAVTDALETDTIYGLDKDEGVEQLPDSGKSKRGKLTLPPAIVPPKPKAKPSDSVRPSLSHMPISSKPKPNPRIRSGGAVGHENQGHAKLREAVTSASNKRQSNNKSFDFEFDEDSDHDVNDKDGGSSDEVAALLDHDDDDGDANDSNSTSFNGDATPDYIAMLDEKCPLADMGDLEREAAEEDNDDDIESPRRTSFSSMRKAGLQPPTIKENMSNLRKVISDDYKERENFLDIHCRPSSSGNKNVRDELAKKKRGIVAASSVSSGISGGGPMAGSRKHALLAALKVIDDQKHED